MHRCLTLALRLTASATCLSAAVCASITSAHAQSSVQLYGLLDASLGQFQNSGGLKVRRLDSGNLATSYIGFKGSEDLGGGLRANFALESFLLLDTGGQSRVPGVDAFWARNAYVGFSGGFGSVRLGRTAPPLFVSTLLFNALGDSFGYSPSIRQYYNAPYGTPLVGDSGWNNAIAYYTPSVGGLTASVLVSAGEGAATSKGHNQGANVLYFGGPVTFTAAYQKVEVQGTLGRPIAAFAGFGSQSAYQFGASYDAKFAKFYAQYGVIDTKATKDVKAKNLNLSASVPLGSLGTVLVAYGVSDITTAGSSITRKSKMATLAYDYQLSKRTDVYAVAMADGYTGLKRGDTFAVGVRHNF